jgi:hypothetical protein
LPIPDGAIGDLRFRKVVRGVKGPARCRKQLKPLAPAARRASRIAVPATKRALCIAANCSLSVSLTCEDVSQSAVPIEENHHRQIIAIKATLEELSREDEKVRQRRQVNE